MSETPQFAAFRYKSILRSCALVAGPVAVIYIFYRSGLETYKTPETKALEAILLAFFSSIWISVILDFILRQDFIKVVRQETKESISEVVNEQSNIQANGLRNVHAGLPYGKFLAKLKNASDAIILNTLIPDTPSLLDEVREMTRNGGKIRILVLNPESTMVEVRAKSLNRSVDYVRQGILTCIEDFDDIARDLKCQGGLQLRVYDTFPSVSLYKADDMMFIGHYILGVHAVEGPQLELYEEKYYSNAMLDHFDKLWDLAKEFDIRSARKIPD